MSRLTPNLSNAPVDLFQSLAPASAGNAQQGGTVLGSMITGADGREFRWCYAGASNLVAGTLQQSPAQISNHVDQTVSTQAIGDTQITFTPGNTLVTANQYAGGYLQIEESTGLGYSYQIASHPAANASTAFVITLADPILIATVTATTKGTLVANPYNGVIQNPTTATGSPVGVAPWILPTATFGWLQVHGVAVCLNDASTTVGLGLAPSTNTAGAVFTQTSTGAQVGHALFTGTTTKYCAMFLTL